MKMNVAGWLLASTALVAVPVWAQATTGDAVDKAPMTLGPVTVEGAGAVLESATGPVTGFVANRSAAGSKTDTPLVETPQAVSVITRDQIDAQNAQSLNQVMRYVAGVTPETRGSVATRYDQLTLRGFTPGSYLDGLRLVSGSYAGFQLDTSAVERVEVLRGPASVLYGQASPAGLVNFVSKRPTGERFNQFDLQYGSFNTRQASVDLGGSLNDDKSLLYRFNGLVRAADGQVDLTESRRIAINPSVTWKAGDDTTITVLAGYQRDPKAGSYGSVPAAGSALPNRYGEVPRNFYDGDPNFETFDRTQASLGYEVTHRLNGVWTLRQNARWMHSEVDYKSVYGSSTLTSTDPRVIRRATIATLADLDGGAIDNQAQARFDTGPVHHTLLMGFDYYRQRLATQQRTGGAPDLNIFAPVYNQFIPNPPVTSSQTQISAQSGVYAQDQIKIDRLVFLLGGRVDWASSETTNRMTNRTTDSFDRAMTGRVGVVYLFDNGIAPYASYSESFEPQSGTDFSGKPFEPTRGAQYEVGVRYQPPGSNSLLTLSLFDLRRTNVTTSDPAHTGYSVQTGEVRSRGVELEGRASLGGGVSATAAYSYLDNKVTKSTTNTVGTTPYGVAAHTASGWLDYTVSSGPLRGLGLGVGARFVGSTFGDAANSFKVPSYTLADAAIRYDLSELRRDLDGWQVAVNASNLFDRRYVTACYSTAWCWYGPQRAVMASLKAKL